MALDAARAALPASPGFGMSHGGLEKLTILYTKGPGGKSQGEIKALFNPATLTIATRVDWREETLALPEMGRTLRPPKRYPPPTLHLDLFFDASEGDPRARAAGLPPARTAAAGGGSVGAAPSGASVEKYTREIADLARVERDLHHPPVCTLKWGVFQLFEGVLTHLVQTFTLFLPDGTPVRATLSCTFKQFQSVEGGMRGLDPHSADIPKTRTVRRGDTLSGIAAEEYDDPALWRRIAEANNITNPLALAPGRVLSIPKLT